jgi:hypothetical protein
MEDGRRRLNDVSRVIPRISIKRSIDGGGENRANPNAASSEFLAKSSGERDGAVFGRYVGTHVRNGQIAEDGCDIHDRPLALASQDRQYDAGTVDVSEKIRLYYSAEVLCGHVLEIAANTNSGIIDPGINTVEFANSHVGEVPNRLFVANVGRNT